MLKIKIHSLSLMKESQLPVDDLNRLFFFLTFIPLKSFSRLLC